MSGSSRKSIWAIPKIQRVFEYAKAPGGVFFSEPLGECGGYILAEQRALIFLIDKAVVRDSCDKKTKPKTAAAGSGFEAFLKIRKREGLLSRGSSQMLFSLELWKYDLTFKGKRHRDQHHHADDFYPENRTGSCLVFLIKFYFLPVSAMGDVVCSGIF